MSYQPRGLKPVYDPTAGHAQFVLYTEPEYGIVGAAWNGIASIERESPYVKEWLGRLQPCAPNALHTTLVDNGEIPRLFHPCVDEDKASPSLPAGEGCTCYLSWVDPAFGLPVVGQHFRTIGGNTGRWTYTTYAPLALRADDAVESVVVEHGAPFWARTRDDVLAVLPMLESNGYGTGPKSGGGGSRAFADYLQQLLNTDGRDHAARVHHRDYASVPLRNWVRSEAATSGQSISLRAAGTGSRGHLAVEHRGAPHRAAASVRGPTRVSASGRDVLSDAQPRAGVTPLAPAERRPMTSGRSRERAAEMKNSPGTVSCLCRTPGPADRAARSRLR
ncbi:hypothetical protein ABZ725_47195 [Streptomyces sp. NPDC006872]|uniref:hypothetical protein n=1 Tax=Streptomyces sp. NPDC006872 TaxID=3155720 RepID=UPI0033F96BC8